MQCVTPGIQYNTNILTPGTQYNTNMLSEKQANQPSSLIVCHKPLNIHILENKQTCKHLQFTHMTLITFSL